MTSIKKIIESIGLSPENLAPYIKQELKEFLNAKTHEEKKDEFQDVIFALKCLGYAHVGEHLEEDPEYHKNKMNDRLKEYATISKKEPIFENDSISKIPIGVVHFSPGNFKQPWNNFDPMKSGTETEIVLLTDNYYKKENEYTNHLIITFDNVDQLEYKFLTSSWNTNQNNTILCRIPDFLFNTLKKDNDLWNNRDMLSLQLIAAIKRLNIDIDSIFHFHSWESGVGLSDEFMSRYNNKKIFSPYLTIGPLKVFMDQYGDGNTTLSNDEIGLANKLESDLINRVDLVIVESKKDKDFYIKNNSDNIKIEIFSYTGNKKEVVKNKSLKEKKELKFITGGRPVSEKGFLELIEEFKILSERLKEKGYKITLDILCKEYDRKTKKPKRESYIKTLENKIKKMSLENSVFIKDKVSISELNNAISKSDALIIPSLYDPYCLMPYNAIKVDRVSFVSLKTGISENIISQKFIFNPIEKGNLTNKIIEYLEKPENFILENKNKSYKEIYLT